MLGRFLNSRFAQSEFFNRQLADGKEVFTWKLTSYCILGVASFIGGMIIGTLEWLGIRNLDPTPELPFLIGSIVLTLVIVMWASIWFQKTASYKTFALVGHSLVSHKWWFVGIFLIPLLTIVLFIH